MLERTDLTDRELILTRTLKAPRTNVYRAWTEPALLQQWFAPKPYETPKAELDVRPGGSSLIVMRGPDGTEFPNRGVYLEVVPNERLVFTDAYTKAWEPSAKPFMTVTITLEDDGPDTKYTPAPSTGPKKTATSTKRWASTRAGASAPNNLKPSPPPSSSRKPGAAGQTV